LTPPDPDGSPFDDAQGRLLPVAGREASGYAIIFLEKEKPGSGAKWVGLNTPGQGTRSWVRGYHRITWMGPLTQVDVWAVFD